MMGTHDGLRIGIDLDQSLAQTVAEGHIHQSQTMDKEVVVRIHRTKEAGVVGRSHLTREVGVVGRSHLTTKAGAVERTHLTTLAEVEVRMSCDTDCSSFSPVCYLASGIIDND